MQDGMDDVEVVWNGGVAAAFGIEELERERFAAAVKKSKEVMSDPDSTPEECMAANDEVCAAPPLWQRICGFDPTVASEFEPGERRAGLRRLVRAVERMYRAELKNLSEEKKRASDPATVFSLDEYKLVRFEDGARSYAASRALFDPLPEICAYLGIAQRKLSEFCRQLTGLRMHEIGDCIRAEGLRARLRERFRELAREWQAQLSEREEQVVDGSTAWRFVRWVRGRGRGETRKKLAWELGVATPARLGRAAFVCERATVEEMELSVAKAVLSELMEAERREGGVPEWVEEKEHGAEVSDVGGATTTSTTEHTEDTEKEGAA